MKTYVGIADAHGIESFMPGTPGKVPMTLALRAQLNRQRHALTYQVQLSDADKIEVDGFIKRQNFKGALRFLKKQHTFGVEESMARSINMIPNDNLDPYWNQ